MTSAVNRHKPPGHASNPVKRQVLNLFYIGGPQAFVCLAQCGCGLGTGQQF